MKRKIELIFGKTGSGKSLFCKRELLPGIKRCIIIDALLEYENGIIFYKFEDLLDYCKDNELYEPEKEFCLVARFDNDLDLDYLFLLVYKLSNLTLIVEEAEIYISPNVRQSNFLKLVRYGRHKAISIIGIARRTSELSRDFRSQTDVIYSFKQTDFNDLKNMSDLGLTDLENLEDYKFPQKQVLDRHYKKIEY